MIRGEYKKYYVLEPIKIATGKYILNYDAMIPVQAIRNPHVEFIGEDWFIKGDGSPNDLIYQQYLIDNQS
jgi:hypothetical protein